ncbi:hypothetical protein EV421DRAFT_1914253 [Armillaria borealis]|uniref:Uncharacterized protein n=1 Tax=Armillaria borealis TaxID=47425 RepID=A0AA39ISM9_9AGAR|nr:hypothetical protein EV421DRAFT_1914253 [Armillaria borealis]
MPDDDVASDGLSSPEGQALVWQLICPRLPHDIHDYVLEGICKALDGTHIISVVKIGGGKTTYFSGYMIALQVFHKQAESSPGLEGDMEILFNSLGLPALAINEDTLAVAKIFG